MKRIISLNDKIKRFSRHSVNESKQVGTIYHICSLKDYLKWILPNDTLQASGQYYNFIYGGNHYVSFTRDKGFVLDTRDDELILVQLVVDGDKLSENYRVRPYNDFAFGKNGKPRHDDFRKREMEECVEGPIRNISKYIIEVRFDIAATHELSQELNINTLKRKKKVLGNLVYHKFIRGKSADIGIPDGTPLKDALPAIERWLDSESLQEKLFSYDEDEIEEAIDEGADVNKRSVADGYPLEFYCDEDDNLSIVEMLLDAGADPDIMTKDGIPLISYAIDCMCDDVTEALANVVSDIDVPDKQGKTPLMHAAEADNTTVIEVLVDAGADVNAVDRRGNSVLSYATEDETIELLESLGAE